MADDEKRNIPEEEIVRIAGECVGKTFGDLGLGEADPSNKGNLGGFVEEHVYGYPPNSDDSPDFLYAEIELKVTPVRKLGDGQIVSKERLVLNMINYREEGGKTFETSSFYKKNRRLLIMFYLYSKGVDPRTTSSPTTTSSSSRNPPNTASSRGTGR